MTLHILDASAVLAWLQREAGTDTVDPLLAEAVVSAPNWSEVLQKAAQKSRDSTETGDLLKGLGVRVIDLTEDDAVRAAALWSVARNLSLADRCCLALARRLDAPAVTSDNAWKDLGVGVRILVIR